MPVINNPYRKTLPSPLGAHQWRRKQQQHQNDSINHNENMGVQSQRRLTLKDRTHKMKSLSPRKKKGQLTIFGSVAFDPKVDCKVCKARLWGRTVHRAHHKLCWNNRRTKGLDPGALSQIREEKRLATLFATPLTDAEKGSSKHATSKNGDIFFAPRVATKPVAPALTKVKKSKAGSLCSASLLNTDDTLTNRVIKKLHCPTFCNEQELKRAPLAMQAFAAVVVEQIIRPKDIDERKFFDQLTITVPAPTTASMDPHYHSIIGQKLLYIDWIKMFGLQLTCPTCETGVLINDRRLFPVFVMEGPPLWCIVMSMTCSCCRARHQANSGDVLCRLPSYARSSYPVEPKYALPNRNSHLGATATVQYTLFPGFSLS